MSNTTVGATIEIEYKSIGDMRKALKEASDQLLIMQQQFGLISPEAQKAADRVKDLKDKIENANNSTQLLLSKNKFASFTQSLSTVAQGFSAVQSGIVLLGGSSEDLTKSLAKVQAGMAFANALGEIGNLKDAFKNLKDAAITAFRAIKGAIGSTGIGLLVIALGSIVAYWDEIKGAITGVSDAQAELNKKTEENVKLEQDKLTELNNSDNILKQQGLSEAQILDLKIKQIKAVIAATEAQIEQAEITKKSQVAAAERNQRLVNAVIRGGMEIATGILRFFAAPIDAVIVAINAVGKLIDLPQIDTINEKITSINQKVADWGSKKLFDPIETANDADANIKTLKSQLLKHKNDLAGFEIAKTNLNKQGNAQRSADNNKANDEDAKNKLAAEEILYNARKSLKTQREQELMDLEKKRLEEVAKLDLAGITDRVDFDESYRRQKQAIEDKYDEEEEKKRKEFLNNLNKINEQIRLAGIKDLREKEKAELIASYEEQLNEIRNNENYNFFQKLALTTALRKRQKQEEDALNEKFRQEDLQKDAAKLLENAAIETDDFTKRLKLLEQRKALENQIIFASQEERDKFIKENEEATTKVLSDQYGARVQLAKSVGDALSSLTDIVGKETAAGKALAIAQATINTFLGITEVWKSKAVLPEPFNTATKIAATITTAAGGFAAVRNIAKTKVPGGGGGGAPQLPNMQTTAPMSPTLSPAVQGQALNAEAINNLGNQAMRAYVLNSDIQNNSQRNAYLQRNARIG